MDYQIDNKILRSGPLNNLKSSAALKRSIPYGWIGEPGDITQTAVWLASREADYITGTTIFVDGDMLIYPGFRTGE